MYTPRRTLWVAHTPSRPWAHRGAGRPAFIWPYGPVGTPLYFHTPHALRAGGSKRGGPSSYCGSTLALVYFLARFSSSFLFRDRLNPPAPSLTPTTPAPRSAGRIGPAPTLEGDNPVSASGSGGRRHGG